MEPNNIDKTSQTELKDGKWNASFLKNTIHVGPQLIGLNVDLIKTCLISNKKRFNMNELAASLSRTSEQLRERIKLRIRYATFTAFQK